MAADLAIVGAAIRTMDPERPFASAVAILDGRIVAVGDDATVRAVCDAKTTLIDGAGMHITPGIVDSHFHAFWGSEMSLGVDLSHVRTLDELRAELRRERERVGPDAWIRGWGLIFEVFQETGIRGDLIAEAVGGGLAYIQFFDLHTAVVSPAAISYCDLTGRERFPDTSEVVVDAQGVPTGELREFAAYRLVLDAMPQMSEAEKRRLYAQNMRIWNSCGITQVHNMDGTPATFDLARELEASGQLSVRINIPLWQKPEATFEEMESLLKHRDERGRRWWGGSAKFFIDGVTETGTGWFIEPDKYGQNHLPFWPDAEKYTKAVALFAKAGFQCITHALGDMAVRHSLDAYEAAGAAPGVRHRVEHVENLTDADLPRFAKLGVVASMQPLHMAAYQADGSDVVSDRIGPERRTRVFRTRDLLDSGAMLALGSDWMVAPYDPRICMAWTRARRTPGHPELAMIEGRQALTGEETLAGYTTGAAKAVTREHIAGKIREGFYGDLSCFDQDLVTTAPDDLAAVRTLLTVVDGEVVYQAER